MPSIAQLTPPIFAFGLARIDTAAHNVSLPYAGDTKYFRNNPKRRSYLRSEWLNEFDRFIQPEYKSGLPRLHVLVVELSEGIHYVTPVFRTEHPFWSEPATDADLASIVAEMGRLRGFNLEEMKRYAAGHCKDVPSEFTALVVPAGTSVH